VVVGSNLAVGSMFKTIIILSIIFFGFVFNIWNQNSKFTLVKSIPTTSSFLTTDNLGNSYLLSGSILEKYDADGNFLKNFSNKNLGPPTFVDATNPFKILVFYKSFQQIILLDNTLSPSGNPVSLDALGYNQISLVCSSHNNGFWIYNQQNFELIRFDHDLQKIIQTGNIVQLTGTKIEPDFIIEQNNKVFLNDPKSGILIFDIYGTFNKTIPLKGLHHFQINNEQIFYIQDDKLKSYNMKTLEENEALIPETEVLDARIEKEKLYLLKQIQHESPKQKKLYIYTYTK
jgi:hypothetical protein